MSSTLNIFYLTDLYEVEVEGYLVRKVTRHSRDGYYKEINFEECPEKVQDEIVQKVLELHK